ncbi:MAG: pentapeptide repeat-containing protein [Nitrospirae bacterium]|nr:pentapeptide repeat-containing protein [Nitrospirota bacterium]
MKLTIPESPESKNEDKEILNAQIDKSSSYNRNLLMLTLSILAYVFTVCTSTTDVQLLMPGGTVKLPVLTTEIPLLLFFKIAPILIFILHLNLFINIYFHSRKVARWVIYNANKESKDVFLPPFIFNYRRLHAGKKISIYLLDLIIWILYCMSPVVVLVWIASRFLPYHDNAITIFHKVVITIDLCLILIFWPIALYSRIEDDSVKRFLLIRDFFKPYMNIVFQIILCFFVWFLIIIPETRSTLDSLMHRNLDVIDKVLLNKTVSDVIIQRYLAMGKTKKEAGFDYAEGLDLRNRDLRFADLSFSTLMKARLTNTNLQGANLSFANLQGANLYSANLQDTDLTTANLQGAYLYTANLQNAALYSANLKSDDLSSANLQGTDLSNSNLQGANLHLTNLQGAFLSYANFQGADLSFANLRRTDFASANLQGADLSSANLQGTYLNDVKIEGAYIDGAKFDCFSFDRNLLNDNVYKDIEIDETVKREQYLEDFEKILIKGALEKYIREKCGNFNKASVMKMLDAVNKNKVLEEFTEVRKQLACEDSDVAKGILRQHKYRDLEIGDEIRKHMQVTCKDIYEKIKPYLVEIDKMS